MSWAIVHSRASAGIQAPAVSVEVHVSGGLPRFSVVGLPETTVQESKDRVRSALLNSQFEFPRRRITVNLGPADLPKQGSRFDLPIALGILAATEQIPRTELDMYEFTGELALSGEIRPIQGALPFALATCLHQRKLVLPVANAEEASLASNSTILPAAHLLDVAAHLCGSKLLLPHVQEWPELLAKPEALDMVDVLSQYHAKRALEIAAAGQHSLLMTGPPGTGKSMLANRLPGILPDMDEAESLEAAAIQSICQDFDYNTWKVRPFRAPHHTTSCIALVGGGSPPSPGEISRAHYGVLFLDELPEFSRAALEALREPLELGYVAIARATYHLIFPARFQLVAAMNPCPCGFYGQVDGRCQCSELQIQRYQTRISGPLLDRMDLHVNVPLLAKGSLSANTVMSGETTAIIKMRVSKARQIQLDRTGQVNSRLTEKEIKQVCRLCSADQALLEDAMETFKLSARAYHRVLKVARSIADLADSIDINSEHLMEALSYRRLSKKIVG